jgi:hypothetical protein
VILFGIGVYEIAECGKTTVDDGDFPVLTVIACPSPVGSQNKWLPMGAVCNVMTVQFAFFAEQR